MLLPPDPTKFCASLVVDGDIVAARVEGDVVVRRVRTIDTATPLTRRVRGLDATTVELRAESTSRRHKTVRYDTRAGDIEIIGVVIGVVRRMRPGPG